MKRQIFYIHVLFAIFSIVCCLDADVFKDDDKYVPLPKHVKPTDYLLWIHPNLTQGTYYNGTVVITVIVSKSTDTIILHSKNLTIQSAMIMNETVLVQKDVKNDFLILRKKSFKITKGTYNITIRFEGDMGDKKYGFYRGYDIIRNKKEYFGTTFFKPTNARTAFPCFDEPQLKATFSLGIARANDEFIISNTRSIGTTILPNNIGRENFLKSPPISTYLVMWFVGKFCTTSRLLEMDPLKNDTTASLRVRTTGRPSNNKKVMYAADQLPKLVKWFRNYTGIEWMCSDFDYVALPDEFHIVGGMENWGAVTTRESSIFYSTKMSLLESRRAKNLAHEIAHHWFGDLVTTSSWGEVWLNEGFARFMDLKIDDLYPEFNESVSNYAGVLQLALWRDDDTTSLPLVRKIKKRKDVFELLNIINYEKGGAVLKMVENVVGKKVMKKVLQKYLMKFMYKNVVSQDFVDVLQEYVDFNATDFLDGFLRQPGYPQVFSQLVENGTKVILTKRRFLRYGLKDKKPKKWTVPIQFITNLHKKPKLVWFPSNENQMIMEFPKRLKWIKLNYKQGAYYRSHYCYSTWKEQIKVMKNFTVEDRINIIDDAIATVRSGSLPCPLAIRTTSYLSDEDRIEVWITASNFFAKIRAGLVQHHQDIEPLEAYVTELIDKQYNKYSWDVEDNETYSYKFNRLTIFNLACEYGHRDCLQKIKQRWETMEDEHIDIQKILKANDPYATNISNRQEQLNQAELQSHWFGADLSKINMDRPFKWPKKPIKQCAQWLEKRMKNKKKLTINQL